MGLPKAWIILMMLNYAVIFIKKINFFIPRLSLNKTSTMIGWFLAMCPWSNSNVSQPGYNSGVAACTKYNRNIQYITKHLI